MVPIVQASGAEKLAIFYVLKTDKSSRFPINHWQLKPFPTPRRRSVGGEGFYQRYYLFNDSSNVTSATFLAIAKKAATTR